MSLADRIERMRAAWPEIGPPLVDYLRTRLRSADEARDAAQETYVRVLNCNDPEAILDLKTYTFTVAKNVATQWLRKRARRRRLAEKWLQFNDEEHRSPERVCAAQSELEELIRALEELPAPVQMVCKAEIAGETASDIAARLGMHLRTVYRHLIRAQEHLARVNGMHKRGERDHE